MSFAVFILVLVGTSTAIITGVVLWPFIVDLFGRYIDRMER
ncbi:hypothetical protein [Agrobacterium vitis]|nr:hypothetical protein [Agrobacterium vitis]